MVLALLTLLVQLRPVLRLCHESDLFCMFLYSNLHLYNAKSFTVHPSSRSRFFSLFRRTWTYSSRPSNRRLFWRLWCGARIQHNCYPVVRGV